MEFGLIFRVPDVVGVCGFGASWEAEGDAVDAVVEVTER